MHVEGLGMRLQTLYVFDDQTRQSLVKISYG